MASKKIKNTEHIKNLLEKRNFLYCDKCGKDEVEKEYYLMRENEYSDNNNLWCEECVNGGVQ